MRKTPVNVLDEVLSRDYVSPPLRLARRRLARLLRGKWPHKWYLDRGGRHAGMMTGEVEGLSP